MSEKYIEAAGRAFCPPLCAVCIINGLLAVIVPLSLDISDVMLYTDKG